MTNAEYSAYVDEKAPKSKLLRNICLAYLVGGLICVAGEGFVKLYEFAGLPPQVSSAATSVTMIFLGSLFTALRVYDRLAKHAGAGTLVPITGFANAIVSPAMEFKTEGLVLGMSARMFTIAGPVLVFGLVASVLYGLILVIV